MKKFYVIAMLFTFAFCLNANAGVKKMNLSISEAQTLRVGNTIKGQYDILAITPKAVQKGKKTADDGYAPYGVGTGTYTRTVEDHGLVDPGEMKCNIYSKAGEKDTLWFKIEKFFKHASSVNKETGDTTWTTADLEFQVAPDNKIFVPVTDLNIFIKVYNRTTGEEFEVECYCSDVATYYGENYRAYYPSTADLAFGLFDFNLVYFCQPGSFGLSEEQFLMDGTAPIWTDWKEIGTADYASAMWGEADEETGEVIDSGIQHDIVVLARTYNPRPNQVQYKFLEWGAGYFSKSGVDLVMDIDKETQNLIIYEQETGDTYYDEEEEIDYGPWYVRTLPDFNSTTWPEDKCGSIFDPKTDEGTIWPGYYFVTDPSAGSCSGYWSISTDGTYTKKWNDAFAIYRTAPDPTQDEPGGLRGDANNDGEINVADITTIAAYILDKTQVPASLDNADANADGEINVADITTVASMILGGK